MQFLYFNIDDGVLPLKFSYYELLANLMFEIRHTNAPSNIHDLFQDISDIHSCNTHPLTLITFTHKVPDSQFK